MTGPTMISTVRRLGPARASRAGRRRGFTRNELVVVMAIAMVLVGLILPAVGFARQAAHSACCKGNLHQLGIAMSLYVNAHNGRCMPVSNDGGNLSFWFGRRPVPFGEPGFRNFDRTQGYLYPYIRVTRTVEQCPGFDAAYRAEDGKLVGYAYNWRFDITAGVVNEGGKLYVTYYKKGLDETVLYRRIRKPTKLIVFVDGGRVSRGGAAYYTPVGTVEENYYLDPPFAANHDCGVHFRHNGLANALFADWHVEELEPRDLSPTGDGRVGHFCDESDWVESYCRDEELGKTPLGGS